MVLTFVIDEKWLSDFRAALEARLANCPGHEKWLSDQVVEQAAENRRFTALSKSGSKRYSITKGRA